jgi:hypothetical protein
MRAKTIRVRAADGRVVVFPQGTLAGPGRTSFRLAGVGATADGATEGELEVNLDAFVRGRLRAGDLVEVEVELAPGPEGDAVAAEPPNRRATDQTAAEPSKNMRAPAGPNLAAKKE